MRMTGRVAQPADPIDLRGALKKARQRPGTPIRPVAVIGVDVLADQRDLADPGRRQMLDFGEDFLHRPRDFRAARIGHDAEGAELVTTLLHGDESGNAARADCHRARRREVIEFVVGRELGVDGFAAAFRARQQFREPVIILRPEDQIDYGRTADDLFTFGLRDTAGDGHDNVAALSGGFVFHHAHAAEFRIDLLGGLLADIAGIEDDEIGVFGGGCLDIAFRRQGIRHTTRVVDVHLATIGFDVQFARFVHAGGSSPSLCFSSRIPLQRRSSASGGSRPPCRLIVLPGFPPKRNAGGRIALAAQSNG